MQAGTSSSRSSRAAERTATAVAVMVAVYFLAVGVLAWGRVELLTTRWYLANAALLVVFGASAIGAGFFRSRRGAPFAGLSLLLGVAALFLSVSDVYVVGFRFDTSGPGGALNMMNTHWWDRFVRKNEAGFWERSVAPYYTHRQGESYLIAAVGDSFTFGQGVLDPAQRFSNRLQTKLQLAFGSGVEVLNYGWGSGDTKSETQWIRESVSKVHPDLVMVFYLANDIEDLGFVKPPPGYAMSRAETMAVIASPTVNFLYWRLAGPLIYAPMGSAYFRNLLMAYVNEERMSAHLDDVGSLVTAIYEIGARPVLVILPFPHLWREVNKEWEDRIYAQIGGRAAEHGALVLNLSSIESEITPDRFQVNPIDGHPNPAAHALIADHIFKWMSASPELRAALVEGGGRRAARR